MNWKALRRTAWLDLVLALTLLILGLRAAHSQTEPTPADLEKHLEYSDKQLLALIARVDSIDEKVSQMWGIGIMASALATGSFVVQVRKK